MRRSIRSAPGRSPRWARHGDRPAAYSSSALPTPRAGSRRAWRCPARRHRRSWSWRCSRCTTWWRRKPSLTAAGSRWDPACDSRAGTRPPPNRPVDRWNGTPTWPWPGIPRRALRTFPGRRRTGAGFPPHPWRFGWSAWRVLPPAPQRSRRRYCGRAGRTRSPRWSRQSRHRRSAREAASCRCSRGWPAWAIRPERSAGECLACGGRHPIAGTTGPANRPDRSRSWLARERACPNGPQTCGADATTQPNSYPGSPKTVNKLLIPANS